MWEELRMEVRVDTYVESRHGIRKVINRAYVVNGSR